MTSLPDALMVRAKALKLHGLLAHWEDIATTPWVAPLIAWEEDERARRGLERRLGNAHLGLAGGGAPPALAASPGRVRAPPTAHR